MFVLKWYQKHSIDLTDQQPDASSMVSRRLDASANLLTTLEPETFALFSGLQVNGLITCDDTNDQLSNYMQLGWGLRQQHTSYHILSVPVGMRQHCLRVFGPIADLLVFVGVVPAWEQT